MSVRTDVKIQQQLPPRRAAQQEVRRNLRAWRGLYRVLRSGKAINPVVWQRNIRKEWERRVRA